MLLLFLIRVVDQMTTCLGKSCSFDLLCVSCVGVCQFVSVLLSILEYRVGCWIRSY